MKRILQLMICLLPLTPFAQSRKSASKTSKLTTVVHTDTGVQFVHHLTWSDVQRKAKAENKYIFMDCYTTWCGPCKFMSKTIFPQKAVGDAMNDKFIAVKMQLDSTDADNEEVKSMYGTAHAIARNYNVNVYPTFLFFNPNGDLVHRAVGSSEAEAFIAKTKEALNPETQYYTLLKKYNKGQKDSAFLRQLTAASMSAYDMENGSKIANDYFATQPDLYTSANLLLLRDMTQSSADKGFQMMLSNPGRVDSVLGKGTANAITQNIILREDVYPKLFPRRVNSPQELTEPSWDSLSASLQSKYPAQAASLMAYSKTVFYMQKQEWEKFGPAVVDYMKSYGEGVSEAQLNEFAWTVFQNCSDGTCLQNALEWSKRSFEKEQNPAFMDTYANILYRLGKTDEALEWEGKALNLVSDAEKPGYQQTIDKMKAGTKTWN